MSKTIALLLVLLCNGVLLSQRPGFFGQNMQLTTGPQLDNTTGHSCSVNGTNGGTSFACAVTVTAGEFIGIGASVSNVGGTVTVTDSQSNTVTAVMSPVLYSSSAQHYAYYIKNATAGSHTITFTSATFSFPRIYVVSVTNANATTPIDGTSFAPSAAPGPTGTAIACGTLTTTSSNDLILAFGYSTGGPATATTGYFTSNLGTSPSWASKVGFTAGAYTPGFTSVAGSNACIAFGVKK